MKKVNKLVEVHEVYEDQLTQYDPQTGNGGLFVQYIDTFLKLKAEGCWYPTWVQCPADEVRYISEFADSESIQLDKDAIESNPAHRGQAKLCLNSMWDKLTERNDRTRKKIISEPQELYRLLANPVIEIATIMFASYDVEWASWQYNAEKKVPNLRHTNAVIGA